jgi:tetratricopeptide (TPR) repeat protein
MESRAGRLELAAAVEHLKTALRLRPNYLQAVILLGEVQLIRGRSDAAVPILIGMANRYQSNNRLAYLLGVHLFRLNRYAEGAPYLEQVAAADSKTLDARVLLARYHYRQRSYGNALKYANEAAKLDSKDADLFGLIGNIYLRLDRLDKAARAFRQVLRLRPESIPVRVNLGTVLFRLKEYEKAAIMYEEVLAKSRSLPAVHFNLGSCYYRLSKWPQAIKQFSLYLKVEDSNAQANYFLGKAYAQLRQIRNATQYLARATVLDENDPWAPYALAELSLEQSELETADTFAETALQRAPGEPTLLTLAGIIARERGDYPRSIARLESAIPLAPSDAKPRHELGMTFAISGRTNDAIDTFEAVRTLKPSDSDNSLWLSIARIHRALDHIDAGRTKDALKDLKRALEVNPSSIDAAWNLVLLHDRNDEIVEALGVVQQTLKALPNHPDLHLLAAWILVRDGKIERAQARLKRSSGATDAGLRWAVQAAIHAHFGEYSAARIAFEEARNAGMELGSATALLELDQVADWIARGDIERSLNYVEKLGGSLAPELLRVRAGLVACALLKQEEQLARIPALMKTIISGPVPNGFGLEKLIRDSYLISGWAHYRRGNDKQAEKDLRRHLKKRPNDGRTKRILATLLAERAEVAYARGQNATAEKLITEAIALAGTDPQLAHNAAVATHRKNITRTGETFRRLHEKSAVPEATLNLGLYLEDVRGSLNAAVPLYRQYLKLNGLAAEVARNRLSRRKRIFGDE